MNKLDDWFVKINTIALAISSALFAISFLLIITQVFTRYVIKFSFPWIEELARYTLIYVVLLASGYLLRHNQNPYVEFVYDNLPDKKKYVLNIILYTCITIFLVFLLYNGLESVLKASNKKTPSLRIIWSIPYSAIPLGAFLMLLQMPYLFLRNKQERDALSTEGTEERPV